MSGQEVEYNELLVDEALINAIHGIAEGQHDFANVSSIGTSGSTLTVAGHLGGMTSDFLTYNKAVIADTTGATITQANGVTGLAATDFTADAAYTLVANAISTFAGQAQAATQVNLPAATAGTYCVLQITAEMDDVAVGFTIQTNAATDLFAHQLIVVEQFGPETSILHGVQTGGTASAPTSNELIYTPAAAATNFLGAGSEIFFYCATKGEWLVKIRAKANGTGATGALSVGTA